MESLETPNNPILNFLCNATGRENHAWGGKDGSGEKRGVRERETEKERARQNTLIEGEKMRCQGGAEKMKE